MALHALYRDSLALLTDLYEITMAFGYWKLGMQRREAAFNHVFRRHPFGGGYTVACGLEDLAEFLDAFRFAEDDLAFLSRLEGDDGTPLFEPAFIDFLREMRFECDVDAVPEGTVVFPQEPLVRVRGPLLQGQLIESVVLNIINFQTLIATKAARICQAARGEPVLEFGLRRAQGIDGAVTASRAAYVGGCAATSNVLAGKLHGIPVRGTHAHSWVMSFDDEPAAFAAWASAMPNNCVLLVDTYDTIEGVRAAVDAALALRERGRELAGIRLDSGDLAYLSIQARKMLDDAGLENVQIVASNDLDERIIESLKVQGAVIGAWGVGTRLATANDDPALGGVYKLTAIRSEGGTWQDRIKLSEQRIKVSTPGILQVRRFADGRGGAECDVIFDERLGLDSGNGATVMVDPLDPTRRRRVNPRSTSESLLVPVFRGGRRVRDPEPLASIRDRVRAQLASFHPGIRRFVNPHDYPVGLEKRLHELKTRLVLEARGVE